MTSSGRRILVYGPYPPSPGVEAQETLARVRDLVAEGHEVTVVSPVPSAAHHHADPGSPRGALRVWQLIAGHDEAVVRLDAEGLLAGSDPPRAVPGRLVLGRALRRPARVELHLDRVPPSVSTRWAAAVAGAASSVTVDDDEGRRSLVAAGVAADRVAVRVADAAQRPSAAALLPAWSGSSREVLQRDVRRRAAAARARRERGQPTGPAAVSAPLREIAPLGHAPISSPKPGVAAVKRVIRKLVGWQLDPIIQHVNRLHQATTEAVDRAADRHPPST